MMFWSLSSQFCCFPWLTCLMSVAQYSSGFCLYQDIVNCCKSYPQCLCNGSDFPSFPSFLSFKMQSLQAKLKAKTNSRTIHCLTNQSNRTYLGNKKHLSVTCSDTFVHIKIVWSDTKGDILSVLQLFLMSQVINRFLSACIRGLSLSSSDFRLLFAVGAAICEHKEQICANSRKPLRG